MFGTETRRGRPRKDTLAALMERNDELLMELRILKGEVKRTIIEIAPAVGDQPKVISTLLRLSKRMNSPLSL